MRPVTAAAVVAAATALIPSTASARAFSYGVASSEVSPSSALLWAHALKAGKVQVEVAEDKSFRRHHVSKTGVAQKANDLTVQVRVAHLAADKRYFFFFHQGRQRSVIGTFTTAPSLSASKTIRFAVTGDADGTKTGGHNWWNKDGAKDMATYKAMTREKNDFNVNLGDTIYSDPSAGTRAFTLDQKRQLYRQNLTYPALLGLRQAGPVYNQWDDHEFIDDYTRASQACDVGSVFTPQYACDAAALYPAGAKAFREYMPVTYTPSNGTYRTFRWGKNLEVFILDERSFRSIRASEIKDNPAAPEPTPHVCDNPAGSGQVDPGPQVPQRIRALFALLYPPAANPARPECLAALNDPNRTMLGSSQYRTFTDAIKASSARWKVVVNEVPIMGQPINPYDDWMGYEAEREKLLTYLRDNVKNVAFVTTDFHTNWVNDARIKTFPEEGGPVNSGIMEFVAGGVADHLFGHEVDAFTKSEGSYKLFDSQFFFKQPPDGPGMQCSNLVTFGYVQLTATATKLTVAMKDSGGKPIIGTADGKACGPYVLTAK